MPSQSMIYIVIAVAVVSVFTVYMAILGLISRKNPVQARMHRVMPDIAPSSSIEQKGKSPITAQIETVLAKIGTNPESMRKVWSQRIAKAGIESPNALSYLVFFKVIVQPALLVIGAFILAQIYFQSELTTMGKLKYLIAGAIPFVFGLRGTDIYLSNAQQKRQKILMRSFAEALDLMLVCIEAGLTLDGALGRVCRELKTTHPVITGELDKTRLELTLLGDRTLALQNLAERTGLTPFKSLVSALVQTERFGTSLAETLRGLSEEQRYNRLMDAENKAARIGVIITIPLVFFILPSFMLVIMGPPVVRLMDPIGTEAAIPPEAKVKKNP